MKKLIAILSVFLFAVSAVAAEDVKSEKTITITMEDETFSPKIFWLNPMGKLKVLGTGAGEYTIPFNATGITVTRSGEKLDMKDILNGDEYAVIKGNPGLNTLGVAMTYVGAIAAGAGLGLVMVGVLEGDTSILLPYGSVAAAGLGVMGVGFVINKNNRPTFRKLN